MPLPVREPTAARSSIRNSSSPDKGGKPSIQWRQAVDIPCFSFSLSSRLWQSDLVLFLQEPYLQLGDSSDPGSLSLLWHAENSDAEWSVETRIEDGGEWLQSSTP